MQYKYFSFSALNAGQGEEDLNRFLRGHRVLTVRQEFVQEKGTPHWCVCVEYLEGGSFNTDKGGNRVDYKEVLNEKDFALFSKLRDIRKKLASDEAIPAYAIFTNEQLSEITKNRPLTLQELMKIEGIGQAKAEKYGMPFLKLIVAEKDKNKDDAQSGKPV